MALAYKLAPAAANTSRCEETNAFAAVVLTETFRELSLRYE
jgi:hypothetical protein